MIPKSGIRFSEKIMLKLRRTLSPGTGRVKAPQGRAAGFAAAKEAAIVSGLAVVPSA
jgi:hypothetical protein